MEAILDLVLQLYRAAQDTPLGDFADLALSLLETVIPFCAAVWLAAELERGALKVRRAHSYGLVSDALRFFASPAPQLSQVFALAAANPGHAYQLRVPDLHPDGCQPAPFTLADGSRLETQLLVANCGALSGPASWLALYRAEGRAQFEDRDLRAAGLVMPHLSQALAVNRALHAKRPAPPGSVSAGERTVVRADGTLLHRGARLAEMIRAEYPAWDGVTLPEKLLKEVRRGRVAHFSRSDACVHVSRLGDMLLLTVKPPTLAERLSRQELRVAQLFGAGASHKEIARCVALAPATVRNVLQNVYRKLGVNNKAQLARLIAGSD